MHDSPLRCHPYMTYPKEHEYAKCPNYSRMPIQRLDFRRIDVKSQYEHAEISRRTAQVLENGQIFHFVPAADDLKLIPPLQSIELRIALDKGKT